VQAVLPIAGAHRGNAAWIAIGRPAAQMLAILVAFAFGCLTYAFVTNDFSVAYVAAHSNSKLPLEYRVSAVWGGHEGSLLLWTLMLGVWMTAVTLFSGHLAEDMTARVLGVMGLISAGFLAFMLFTSNPFDRQLPPVPDGQDLNPLLQDPGMVFHPPMLYMGYVGFSVAFSFAVAALLSGKLDAAWARWSRPWTTVAWMFLTLGIALGSGWAYYELGWGGWWFWDPVENASFMPWLVGTALLHSAVVMEKRNALKLWTILLSILAFSLSLLGTFLVRSGVLTSVHSFATDPTRGVFILAILVLFIGGSLALYAWRAPLLKQGGLFAPISREGMLVLNNLFLTTACATVFTGTLYPLALEALTGAKISVGAPYFNLTFAPLFLPLLVAVPFGPLMAWKRGDLLGAGQRLFGALALAILAVAASFAIAGAKSMLAPFVIGLAFFVMAGAVSELAERTQLFRLPAASALARARGLPRSAWGTALAHFGLGVSLLGIVCETQWGAERIASVKPGQTLELRGYELRFDGLEERQGPNYRELAGRFTVSRNGETIAVMEPAKRSFPARENATTEAALMTRGFSQLYLSLGDPGSDGAINVRLYHKPLVLLIWLGAVVMALGGALSLSDRRLRVGAPKPARMKRALQPAE
ncbi:MAG: heme lyase CcmF/NrfE family subunit, partial [Microvirga sp.]